MFFKMDVEVNFKAGGTFVELCPQFSINTENVFVAWKNKILCYNVKTGAQFAEFKGIKNHIVGFTVHYYESHECITACSCTGEVIMWKTTTFFKILNKNISHGIINTFHVIASNGELKTFISYIQEYTIYFCIYDLMKETSEYCGFTISSSPYRIGVSNKYFAVIQRKCLNVTAFKNASKTYTYYIDKSRRFTCVACHPENEIVLTGDDTGRIVLWQNIFTSRPSKAVFHWHTLPVNCLGFSASGSYFYSGGDESVLVRWQIDNNFEKKFLPRLPSTIAQITISPNNTFIAIATHDNAVRVVDARFDNVSLIQHLVIGDSFDSGIVVDNRTKALVMNGNIGQIQFYSTYDNSLLYNVDVVGQNKITNERNCSIENTRVSKIAISKNGLWMATVETWKGEEFSEVRLKFWNFDLNIQTFKLNTSIEDPHENKINSIGFQPLNSKEFKCVTVGADKKFKVWYLTEVEIVDKISQIWKCLCVGFYHNLPCEGLSFSTDGSLVAVSFGNIVTTWLPDTCQIKCVLNHSVCEEDITQVEFGTSNQCHLLVAASKTRISVWNLLTLTMIWTVPVNISILISDAVTTNMAVITESNTVFVFNPISPEPVYTNDKILKDHEKIHAAAFVPTKYSNDTRLRWYQRSPIFFINCSKELFCLGSEEESSETPTEIEEISNSLFSMSLPQVQVDKSKPQDPVQHIYQKDIGQKNIKKYLEAPIQTMIPIRIMCGSLLKSMVLQKS